MKVKLLTPRVGERLVQHAGQIIDVSDALGARLIAARQAVAVVDENAPAPKPRRAKRGN